MAQHNFLSQVLRMVESLRRTSSPAFVPVVLMDLDSTAFDNVPRTTAIIREFADDTYNAPLLSALESLPQVGLPYLLKDILGMIGYADLAPQIFPFWKHRFFTDPYLSYDTPLPGAAEFCRTVHAAGATLVYLSGRDSPNMLVGTSASLRRHGFPVGLAHTVLVLKPTFEQPDLEFKTDVVAFLRTLGEVVGSFDNEPANCNLFATEFPRGLHARLVTNWAPNPPPLDRLVVELAGFEI